MPSTLLAIARGTLAGDLAERKRQEEQRQRDLENAIRLSSVDGISIEDPTAAAPPVVPPAGPVIPGAPGSAEAHRAVLDAAHTAWKTSAAGDTPPPAVAAGTVTPPDAGNRASTAPTPRSAMEVGRIRLGGKEKVINMDPSQTAGGQRKASRAANQAAYDRLNKDGTMGAYEPGYDYRAKERSTLEEGELTKALVDAGTDPKEAAILAKYHIDIEGRRIKTAAERRSETRAEDLTQIERDRLEEQRRHNRASEANSANRKGGPLSKDPKTAFNQVERQISDNRTAIGAARRAMPKNQLAEYGVFASPEDSTKYVGQKAQTDSTVSALQSRGDSLRGVSDSLAAIIQKKPAGSDQLGKGGKLSAADAARAKTDPKFARWLRSKGLL